tara:strand:+ start:295 stop:963 length:669 start_codon:yes stop_codon:yes gene_type:complete
MNKIKIALVAILASGLMVAPSLSLEKRIGISVAITNVNADGNETLKDVGTVSKTEEVSDTGTIPSIFAELAMDNGFGIGIEQVSGSVDMNSVKHSRTDDDEETTGDNTAAAEIDGLTTVYLMKTFDSGFFVKVGNSSTTVNTKEVLATGSTYANKTLDGSMFGFGFTRTNDSGLFLRVTGEVTDYDTLNLTSEVADAVSGGTNTIKADIDTMAAKLSIGKAF